MPEYPDIEVYIDALRTRLDGAVLERVEVLNPFLLRTADPPPPAFEGTVVLGLSRLGKRIVFAFDGGLFAVLHLMIAGRLHWYERAPKRKGLLRMHFDRGLLLLTEAGTKRRASLHLVQGEEALAALDRGGREIFELTEAGFLELLATHNHTLKRFLTDPRLLSGIGNAYSDEILHRARLSPVQLTSRLERAQALRLREAALEVLSSWRHRLAEHYAGEFPEGVTAFRDGMAVHGRFGEPCPDCGTAIQRIRYAENETNYCPRCQTEGRLLTDRALSRLLKKDWPRTIDELETQRAARAGTDGGADGSAG